MPGYNNLTAIELAKADQSQGTTNTDIIPIYTEDGVVIPPLPATSYQKKRYLVGGDQLTDNVLNPFEISGGNASGLIDCHGIGMLLSAMYGIVTPTGTSPYTYVWDSITSGNGVIMHTNHGGAASSSEQHSKAMISDITLSGDHGNATDGKIMTGITYNAGEITTLQAAPTIPTIDKQDVLAATDETAMATKLTFVTDEGAGTTVDYENYTNRIDNFNFHRDVMNGNASLGGPNQKGIAYYSPFTDVQCGFTYDAMSNQGSGTPNAPDWSGLGPPFGMSTKAFPTSLKASNLGEVTIQLFAQEISGGTYYELKAVGLAIMVLGQADMNANTCPFTIEFQGMPEITLINNTASYIIPT